MVDDKDYPPEEARTDEGHVYRDQPQPDDRDIEGYLPHEPEYAKGIQGDKPSTSRAHLLRDGVVYGGIAAVLTIALAFGAAAVVGNDIETDTQRTVRLLKAESEKNREVLCLAVLRPSLEAELTPEVYTRLHELCDEVTGGAQ